MDLHAPFLHEFTYQAMANDLLDITDGTKYRFDPTRLSGCGNETNLFARRYSFRNQNGEMEDKEAILSEDDKVWNEVRHMHMKDALDKLIADFKAYAGEHGGKFGASDGYGSSSVQSSAELTLS
jgi:syntaxin-binding protein 1